MSATIERWKREYATDGDLADMQSMLARAFRAGVWLLPPNIYGLSDGETWTKRSMTVAYRRWWGDMMREGRVRDWVAAGRSEWAILEGARAAAQSWAIDHARGSGSPAAMRRYRQARSLASILQLGWLPVGTAWSCGPTEAVEIGIDGLIEFADLLSDDEIGLKSTADEPVTDEGLQRLVEAVLECAEGAVEERDIVAAIAVRTGLGEAEAGDNPFEDPECASSELRGRYLPALAALAWAGLPDGARDTVGEAARHGVPADDPKVDELRAVIETVLYRHLGHAPAESDLVAVVGGALVSFAAGEAAR